MDLPKYGACAVRRHERDVNAGGWSKVLRHGTPTAILPSRLCEWVGGVVVSPSRPRRDSPIVIACGDPMPTFAARPMSSLRAAVSAMTAVALFASLAACSATGLSQMDAQDPVVSNAAQSNITSLSEVIRANPTNAGPYNVRGTAYASAGQYQQALEDFGTAISINPNFHQAYLNRGIVFRKMGKLDLALQDFDRAAQLNPNYASAFVERANVERQTGKIEAALADFAVAISIDPGNLGAYNDRALVYQLQGNHKAAIQDYDQVLIRDSSAAQSYNGRGISKLALRYYKSALDDFNAAIEIDRTLTGVWVNRGLAQEALGDREGAPCRLSARTGAGPHERHRPGLRPADRRLSVLIPPVTSQALAPHPIGQRPARATAGRNRAPRRGPPVRRSPR